MAASTSSAISIRAQAESGTCERNEFGESLDCEQGSRLRQLAISRRATHDADRRHTGCDRRLHVPNRVADVAAARRLDTQRARGKEKQIRSRLGMLDIATVDDHRTLRQRQGVYRCHHLLTAARGCDRPSLLVLVECMQELEGAGKWLGVDVQVAVDVARATVDCLLSISVQALACRFGYDTGQSPAIRSYESRNEHATGRYSLFLESSQPRRDPRLDRIHKRSVEIEDPRGGLHQIDSG